MYKRCITEQAAQRQRQLTAGLLDAMCTQRYEDITVSSFCQQTNIPRKSFYRYFSSKEGALCALLDYTILDFRGEVFSDNVQATLDTLERFFLFWQQQNKLLTALEHNGLSGVLIQRSIAKSVSDDLISHKLQPFHYNFPPNYIILFLIAGLLSLVIQWHHDGFQQTPKQMAAMATYLLSQPMMRFQEN